MKNADTVYAGFHDVITLITQPRNPETLTSLKPISIDSINVYHIIVFLHFHLTFARMGDFGVYIYMYAAVLHGVGI